MHFQNELLLQLLPNHASLIMHQSSTTFDSSELGGDFGAKEALDFDGERWYANPLCGDSCKLEPWWENVEGGEVLAAENSDTLLGFVLLNEVRATPHRDQHWRI